MAIIGKFTKQANGTFLGGIKTLTINVLAELAPVTKSGEKSPDFRITTVEGDFEIGAAWERTTDGTKYISVRLDDPSLPAPISCRLIKRDERGHDLIWVRDRKRS